MYSVSLTFANRCVHNHNVTTGGVGGVSSIKEVSNKKEQKKRKAEEKKKRAATFLCDR